jgi:hypothetical protein
MGVVTESAKEKKGSLEGSKCQKGSSLERKLIMPAASQIVKREVKSP